MKIIFYLFAIIINIFPEHVLVNLNTIASLLILIIAELYELNKKHHD